MGPIATNDVPTYNGPPLAKREVQLLADFERAGRQSITIDELRELVGPTAKEVARHLLRKGVFQTVRRGTYLIRPLRTLLRPSTVSTAAAVATLLSGEAYYLGGLWAFSHHRLTEQRYSNVVDAFVGHRLAPRQLGPGRVRFHARAPGLLTYGIEKMEVENRQVLVSDLERTLLDSFDYPRLFLGVDSSIETLDGHWKRFDALRLISHAAEGSKTSTCQRLGVLLARRGVQERALRPLKKKVRGTRSLLSMNPSAPRTGHVNSHWSVVENDS